jgi:hypothetical protein
MRAPQFGQSGRKQRAKQAPKPAKAQPHTLIPVEPGLANCDTIRQQGQVGYMRLNTGFWRGTGKGLKARISPIETTAIEPYSGARRARGPATAGQQAHGTYARDPAVKVTMHLWHKSARREGALVPSLQGPIITKR